MLQSSPVPTSSVVPRPENYGGQVVALSFPPLRENAPSEATRFAGPAAVAKAHEQALAPNPRKTTIEMQAKATTLLCTSAAGLVNRDILTMPRTIGNFRLWIGDMPRRIRWSENQPATRQPTKPQAKGNSGSEAGVDRRRVPFNFEIARQPRDKNPTSKYTEPKKPLIDFVALNATV
jgi:hypothetical protein